MFSFCRRTHDNVTTESGEDEITVHNTCFYILAPERVRVSCNTCFDINVLCTVFYVYSSLLYPSVGIATSIQAGRSGIPISIGGKGISSFKTSRLSLGPTQLRSTCTRFLSWGRRSCDVKLTTHLHKVP